MNTARPPIQAAQGSSDTVNGEITPPDIDARTSFLPLKDSEHAEFCIQPTLRSKSTRLNLLSTSARETDHSNVETAGARTSLMGQLRFAKTLRTVLLGGVGLLAAGLPVVDASAEVLSVDTLVVTGDAIPGDDATYTGIEFFTIWDDGEVVFNAKISPFSQGVFRVAEPGVVTAVVFPGGSMGSLGTFGVNSLGGLSFATNDAKTIAFPGYFDTQGAETQLFALTNGGSLQVIVGGRPTDGVTITSGITGNEVNVRVIGLLYSGSQRGELASFSISESGSMAFYAKFGNIVGGGMFVATSPGDLRNIYFDGDPAPSIPGAFLEKASDVVHGTGNRAYFYSVLSGTDTAHNGAVYRDTNGALELIAQKGAAIPGIPDAYFTTFSDLLPGQGSTFFLTGGERNEASGNTASAIWMGTSGSNLEAIVRFGFSDSYIASTDVGDIRFLAANFSGGMGFSTDSARQPLFGEDGKLYFIGSGTNDLGQSVSGVWAYSPIDGSISLRLATGSSAFYGSWATPLSGVDIIGVNASGQMAVASWGRNGDNTSYWIQQANGAMSFITGVGETVDGRAFDGFVTVKRSGIRADLNDDGDLALRMPFQDSNDDYHWALVRFATDENAEEPGTEFLWTGDAGDNDWHKPMNWDIKATGEDATVAPGALEGLETVEIAQSTVVLENSPAHIRSIEAGGSLIVTQPLMIEKSSSIESLKLSANLSTGGTLRLSGDNVWNRGIIYGDGSIDLQSANSTLAINAIGGLLGLETDLSISGVATQSVGTLDLDSGSVIVTSSSVASVPVLQDVGAGSITVEDFGGYVLKDGGIVKGDHPNAKFLLKNFSRLTIASPNEIFGRRGAEIDVPIEATGVTSIKAEPKSILKISKSGNYTGETTIILEESSMHFNGSQTYSGDTTFVLSGLPGKTSSLLFDSEQTDAMHTFSGKSSIRSTKTLRDPEEIPIVVMKDALTVLNGDLTFFSEPSFGDVFPLLLPRFELGDNLDVEQGQFVNKGDFRWLDGVISGGFIQEDKSLQFGFVNDGKFEMGVAAPEGGYRLNGIIRNSGDISIDHNLYFEDGAKILNNKRIDLSGESSMFMGLGSSAEILVIGKSSYINKMGSGTSNIYIPLKFTDSSLGVIGAESTLILKRSVDFYGEKSQTVVTQGQIEFRFDPKEKLTIHKTLTSRQPGSVKVIDSDVLIKDEARLLIEGGQTSDHIAEDGERWLEATEGWEFDGGTTSIGEGGYIRVESSGVLKWRKGVIEGGVIGGPVEIENKGLIEILGDDPHELNNYLLNQKQLTIKSSITGIGGIVNGLNDSEGVVVLNNRDTPIDIGVRLSNTKKVIAAFGTNAIASGAVDQFDSTTFGFGQLTGGEWIISDKANLTLKLDGAEKDIQIIEGEAYVELRGSGNFNGLNNVMGDLDIITRSYLHYRDVKNAKVSGQLNILRSGALRLFGSRLTISEDLEMGSNYVDEVSRSVLSSPSFLVVDETSNLIVNDQFEVLSGGLVIINGQLRANSLDIQNGGAFLGSGRIKTVVDGNLGTFSFTNAGKLIPGNSPGALTIDGDYTQTETGILEIELSGTGTAGTDYDQLIVNGTASLGGTLMLKEVDGFEWSNSVTIPAIQATVFEGTFDQVIFAGTSRRLATPEIVGDTLSVAATTISAARFGDWRSAHFDEADLADESISGPLADPDGDNVMNFLEYAFDTLPQYWNPQPLFFNIQPSAVEDKMVLEASFPWAKGMTDAQYTIQTSQNLKTWNDFEGSVVDIQDGEFSEIITYTGEIDVSTDIPVFARLLVTVIDL